MLFSGFFSTLQELDWKQIWEWFIPAALAFVFAAVLQWRLMARQEKFLTRLEKDRVEGEEKTEQRRLAAENRNSVNQVAAIKR